MYGVELICHAIGMEPSTFCEHEARRGDPERVPARSKREAVLQRKIALCWRAYQRVFGAKKVWKPLNRKGIRVACCTVVRLMKGAGLRGIIRGRRIRTMIPEPALERPRDLVQRDFSAECPN
ncbi:MAG: IS3 family transposase [Gemmatimonadaceae bacterium]|nr:IS3 family transposase [Gemmatimonadaceae bacterium]